MSETPDDLTPEQEELAQKFAAELEGTTGISMTSDEDDQLWLSLGEMAVPITQAEAATFTKAVYDTALAKVIDARPKKTTLPVTIFSWAISLALSVAALAGVVGLAKALIGL